MSRIQTGKGKAAANAGFGNLQSSGSGNPFQRRVDKSKIPFCDIMGVHVAAIDMDWLLNYIENHLENIKGDYLCVANVHTTVLAYENPSYCRVQNGGLMALPDGGPLSSLGRHRGYAQMQRTAGPSFMEEIFRVSAQKGYRHFFYGSTPETLERMQEKLESSYPGISIVGMYSPPFREVSREEDAEIIRRINESRPDFVWVGLGAPKQEIWMYRHQGLIDGLMVGVGAGFDFFAGKIKRAPMWMQKRNLEWLYRLIQEPKRLFGRYLRTNTKFIWLAVIRGK